MRRLYQTAPGAPSSREPPDDDVGDVHGLGVRHWVLLGLLAEHAVLDSGQVAGLLFGSRPAAVRCLGVLVRSGLVWRFVFDDDPTHRAYFEPSPTGLRVLAARLAGAGRPVPVRLGTPLPNQLVVNDVHAALVAVGRASQGSAWLHAWRRGIDTALWLQTLGISRVQPRAYGVWLQDGRAARFLLHVDDNPLPPLGRAPGRAIDTLDGYRHHRNGIPASCLIMITPDDGREQRLLADAADLPLTLAATTLDRLYTTADPSGPIWTLTATSRTRLRLIDVAST